MTTINQLVTLEKNAIINAVNRFEDSGGEHDIGYAIIKYTDIKTLNWISAEMEYMTLSDYDAQTLQHIVLKLIGCEEFE